MSAQNRAEYLALKRLEVNPDFNVLQNRFLAIISDIENKRDTAASRGQESAWRYAAGQEKGAKRIVMALAVAIAELELVDEAMAEESKYDSLLEEIRGDKK